MTKLETFVFLLYLSHSLAEKQGTIKSENYPNDYPDNFARDYAINADGAFVIKFSDLVLENPSGSGSCYDWVMIKEGDGSVLLDKTCGSQIPPPITSKTNSAKVIFHTDRNINNKGFSLDWKVEESKKSGAAFFGESFPSEKWIFRCKNTMEAANLSLYYSTAVGHGIHSMSLQDLRAFFDEGARPDNGIPTANRDLDALYEDIVLKNAPDIPSDFASIGLQTLDVQFQNMDDENYMERSDVLQRLVHSFHMHEIWKAAQPFYENYSQTGVSAEVCNCVLDTAENGIDQELINIFLFFKECHGQLLYNMYFKQLVGNCKGTSMLKVTDSKSWEKKKRFMHKSMPPPEDIEMTALFLYCGLKK